MNNYIICKLVTKSVLRKGMYPLTNGLLFLLHDTCLYYVLAFFAFTITIYRCPIIQIDTVQRIIKPGALQSDEN